MDFTGSLFIEFSKSTLGAPVGGSALAFDRIVVEESEFVSVSCKCGWLC